jgi:tetratricopeptide (TPR) repeat protein
MAISYQDFDLTIQKSVDGYLAWLDSPAGQAQVHFKQPFSESELKEYLPHFGRGVPAAMRGAKRPDARIAEELGKRLFETVFEGDVRDCLRGSLDEAARQGKGLRIRLHLMAAPELSDLPWEFLYNASLRRFLALSVDTPIVRYLEVPESIRPLEVTLPLRVLVMISSPTDYPGLDVEREWAKLNEALEKLQSKNVVTLDRLPDCATLTSLQRKLRASQYHILHYVGHGSFNEQTQDGELVLEDELKRGCLVSGRDLGMLLHDHHAMRLVLLNSCEGARISCKDPFGGTAQTLVLQGIPAVVAMQFEISDKAAITVCREFYGALADGYPVDAALTEARKALYSQGNYLEWGTPVLYMRSPDGRIFELSREAPGPDATALFLEAQAAINSANWTEAIKKLQETLAVDPSHIDAEEALRNAYKMKEVAAIYEAAADLQQSGNSEAALEKYRRVHELADNYGNVDALINRIEDEIRSKPTRAAPAVAPQSKPTAVGAPSTALAIPAPAPESGRRGTKFWVSASLIAVVCMIVVGISVWIGLVLRRPTTSASTPAILTLSPPFDIEVTQDQPDGLYLRTSPSRNGDVIAKLLPRARLTITGKSTEVEGLRWWPAKMERGWVAEGSINLSSSRLIRSVDGSAISINSEVVVIYSGADGLNLRFAPGLDREVIAALLQGTQLTVIGSSEEHDRNIWWPVRINPGWLAEGPLDQSPRWITPVARP